MTKQCVFCDEEMDEERPFDYCLSSKCYSLGFKQAEYVVLGVHKSTPIVCSATDQLVTANKSYMNHK
jgi:hypothetical protein